LSLLDAYPAYQCVRQGIWETKVPHGVLGQSPGGGLRDTLPSEAEQFMLCDKQGLVQFYAYTAFIRCREETESLDLLYFMYTVFQKKTSTHIIVYKLRNSCLILIIFDTKIPHII